MVGLVCSLLVTFFRQLQYFLLPLDNRTIVNTCTYDHKYYDEQYTTRNDAYNETSPNVCSNDGGGGSG